MDRDRDKKVDEFELEDTTEIAVDDYPVGGLLKAIIVALAIMCLFYFFTELTPPVPEGNAAQSGVSVKQEP